MNPGGMLDGVNREADVDAPVVGPQEVGAQEVGVDRSATVERIQLDETSWVDISRRWLVGADTLFAALDEGVEWRASRLFRYDHWVEERRLGSMWRPGTPLPHPALAEVHRALQQRYRVTFNGFGLIRYRDGGDGQAFHRDTDLRWLDETVVAILSLGAQRPWLLRHRGGRDRPEPGPVRDVAPAAGDLLVMGGRTQVDWEHSVPYLLGRPMATRISLQWRYTSRRGRPFVGASYRAPLTYR
jgi:alkylated DNA repair dioxygenase AlkB